MRGISLLMYHQVGKFPPMRSHRATYCDVDRFRRQMAWLRAFRYHVLDMDQVAACLSGARPIPTRAVALTFDDGYENFLTHAAPILERHGFPAIVYVVPTLLGRPARWLAADGHATPRLMDAGQLRELQARGFTIGSHNLVHERMAGQPPEVQYQTARDSKARLEDLLGRPCHHFCYPYGSHDAASLQALARAGYRTGVTCQRATATADFDPLALPRKAVSFGDSLAGVLWKLHAKHRPKRPPLRR